MSVLFLYDYKRLSDEPRRGYLYLQVSDLLQGLKVHRWTRRGCKGAGTGPERLRAPKCLHPGSEQTQGAKLRDAVDFKGFGA